MKLRWRFGILAAIFLAVFCLYPQFKMFYLRGAEWNGHYAYNDIDEVAYASYVRALIDGRPRKNDPYSGRDHSDQTPQPESLFSIQFAAPYSIALPARLLGIGTPWAMTLSGAIAGFLAALFAFWLVARVTESDWYGMAASLVVFAGGALAAGEGAIPELLFDGFSYPYFPGFRRYIPAMAIAAVFALFAVIWKMVGRERSPLLIGAAILCFSYTVFSYFYIWTTAAAWLFCLVLLWSIFRPDGWRRDLTSLVIAGIGCVATLIPYAYLLSLRSETMDHVQLLVFTREPDLWRVPEYIGVFCIVLIVGGLAGGVLSKKDRAVPFALSFALVPVIVFNQQIITGRSLQPIHYQVFIGNYVAALGLVLTIGLFVRGHLKGNRGKAASMALAAVAIAWGFIECHYTVRVLDDANYERDAALPVARRLEELAAAEPDPHRLTVFSTDMLLADDLPSVMPQNILWARHQHVFAGLSWDENKERYYQFLYYHDVDEGGLDELLKTDFVSQIALFGWGRHTDRLSFDAKPLTFGEIAIEVARYAEYRQNFDRTNAASPLITWLVVNSEAGSPMAPIDRWYERDEGQRVGKYVIYRLRLKE